MSKGWMKYGTFLMLTMPPAPVERKSIKEVAHPCRICGKLTTTFVRPTKFSKIYICDECSDGKGRESEGKVKR